MIKAIFYDFDGVIKESTEIKTDAFYDLYLPFGKEIAEKAKDHHIHHGGISRFEKFKHYHEAFLGIDLTPDELLEWAQKFSDIVLKKVIECDYVPGALDAISNLSSEFKQFIVTGTPQSEIELITEGLKIDHLFESIKGSPRNKIEICSEIQSMNEFKSQEIVFIGDATTDFVAAEHHGYHFILREHIENEAIFEAYEVIKTKDLSNLKELINRL